MASSEVADVSIGRQGEGVGVRRGAVGQGIQFHVTPDSLHGIELWCIGRQVLDAEARVALEEAANDDSAMHVEVVPDEDHMAPEMAEQVSEKEDNPLALDIEMRSQGEVKSYPVAPAGYREGADDRDLLPMASLLIEDRSLSARRPGPPHQRREQQAALVEEDEMRVQPGRVFFTRGQSTLTHRWMACSSRSRARRSGFCGLQPNVRRSRPT